MTTHSIWLLAVCVSMCAAQGYYDYQTTPIPILKQINKHNEDGSYSYGYEGADGSFKIETKHPTGEVFGKYGYVDDTGATREVEYGASRRGFEPSGSGINVPPPTLQNTHSNSISGEDGDDGQYREDPTKYYKNQYSSAPQQRYQNTASYNQPQHYNQPQQHYNQPQQHYNQPQQHYNEPQQHYNQPQQHYNQPQHYNHQQYNQRPAPVSVDPNLFIGHPATGFDVNTGSYSVNYSG